MDFLEVVIHTFLKKLKIAFKCNIDGKDIKRHYLLNGFIVLCSTTLYYIWSHIALLFYFNFKL